MFRDTRRRRIAPGILYRWAFNRDRETRRRVQISVVSQHMPLGGLGR